MPLRLVRSFQQTLTALGLGGALFLTAGCGIDSSVLPTTQAGSISGTIHGGPNPVVGATIKLYATASAGYGGAATLLGTTTSGQFGQFGFNPSSYLATCPSNQYVYVTAASGNTGGTGVNANSLLMAVMGTCPTTTATTNVFLSEATTVAAAYALSNFMTISGTGANAVVNVSAPAANNAVSPACTGSGSALTCTAGGLRHAFQNAVNIADSVENGSSPGGMFYTVTPSNTAGLVPQTLLNTIADAVQSCVNSTGGVANDNPATNCGNLFAATTPPTTSTATPVTPTNTLQAMINLAKYPTMTPAQVTSLYNLASATGFFQPNLGAAPNDYSLAIVYKGAGSTALGYPYFLTLDYGDNVYTADNVTSSTGPVNVVSLASNGATQFVGSNISTALCSASSACLLAAGIDGHVWLPNYNTTANRNVYEVSTTDGSLINTFGLGATATPYAATVDRFNSVFVTSSTAATANLFQSAATTGGITFGNAMAAGAAVTESVAPEQLAFDSAGNLWNINYTSTSTGTSFFANSGTTATTFAAAPVVSSESATAAPYSILIDGSNNGWVNTTKTLYEVPSAGTAPTVTTTISYTAPGATTATAASSARYGALDGLGNIFLPDNNTTASKVWQYFPGTNSFVYLFPCATAAGATACGSTATTVALYGPRNAQADSTGSLWVESSTNGAVVQIIGTANPTWPQLSLGKPGVRPQ